MSIEDKIRAFLAGSPHAVIGATPDHSKIGNKVLRAYMQKGLTVLPVNPFAEDVEGLTGYRDLASLPEKPHGISIITPPYVTEKIVEQAKVLGIANIWMQPGSESEVAIQAAEWAGINVISGGTSILQELGFQEHAATASGEGASEAADAVAVETPSPPEPSSAPEAESDAGGGESNEPAAEESGGDEAASVEEPKPDDG